MLHQERLYSSKEKHERRFIQTTRKCGFIVTSPKSIRCLTPVLDKNGELKKTKTVPDCIVIDPETQKSTNVEITGGLAAWPHKEAQRRVVEQARIDFDTDIPYVVITGIHFSILYAIEDIDAQRAYLRSILFPSEHTHENYSSS